MHFKFEIYAHIHLYKSMVNRLNENVIYDLSWDDIKVSFHFAYIHIQNDSLDTEQRTYSGKQKENVPPSIVEIVSLSLLRVKSTLLPPWV